MSLAPRTSPGEHDRKLVGVVIQSEALGPGLTRASLASPGSEMPERSPLMSAAKTEMPARDKPSASTCSVTVLPVPVAPVTKPCRLARCKRHDLRLSALADENSAVRINVRHSSPRIELVLMSLIATDGRTVPYGDRLRSNRAVGVRIAHQAVNLVPWLPASWCRT